MINWKRVFEHIWMQIRWLNSFAHINELALRKILKKFAKRTISFINTLSIHSNNTLLLKATKSLLREAQYLILLLAMLMALCVKILLEIMCPLSALKARQPVL